MMKTMAFRLGQSIRICMKYQLGGVESPTSQHLDADRVVTIHSTSSCQYMPHLCSVWPQDCCCTLLHAETPSLIEISVGVVVPVCWLLFLSSALALVAFGSLGQFPSLLILTLACCAVVDCSAPLHVSTPCFGYILSCYNELVCKFKS
jgi:hypothetical protein